MKVIRDNTFIELDLRIKAKQTKITPILSFHLLFKRKTGIKQGAPKKFINKKLFLKKFVFKKFISDELFLWIGLVQKN